MNKEIKAYLVNSVGIIPLVFLLRERKRSIILGFKGIVGNIGESFSLILLVLLTYVVKILYANYGLNIGEFNKLAFFIVRLIVGFLSMLIDFIVFISAALILNKKLLKV